MNKIEKSKYINAVYSRFHDAKNHGNGNNWWYPKPFTIAYNVKLHNQSKGIDELREAMSKRQNDYFSDESLYEMMSDRQNDDAHMLLSEVEATFEIKEINYAGRSGGWLEVEYNCDIEEVENDTESQYVNTMYQNAKALTKLEAQVSAFISDQLTSYKKYINTQQFVDDIVEGLMDDDDIAEVYKGKIISYANKLQ